MANRESGLARPLKEVAGLTLWEGLKPFMAAAVLGGGLLVFKGVRAAVRAFINDHSLSVVCVGIGFGSLIAFLAVYSVFRIRFYPPLARQSLDFVQTKRELSFEYLSSSEFRHRRSVTVKPLRAGLRVYTDKFMWTGKTVPRVTSDISRHTLTLKDRRGVWQYYEIDLGRALNLNETEQTTLTFAIEDPEQSFVPFISATIDEPTDYLKLSVYMPRSYGVNEATCEISYSMGAKIPCSTHIDQFDDDGWVRWVESPPKMHHYYELRWPKPISQPIPKA